MPSLLRAYRPDASTRAIWTDAAGPTLRQGGSIPERASRIEVIREGPFRGFFSVDFSLLSRATGDPRYAVCLAKPFAQYGEANQAEVDWLKKRWLVGDPVLT